MVHAEIARQFIGDRRGTGGTSGVDYLMRNTAAGGDKPGDKLSRWSRRAEVTAD